MDAKKYGLTIYRIRKDLKLTRNFCYEDIMAKSNAQLFEKGESCPRFDKIIPVLNRIGISFDEFLYVHNGYQETPDEKILRGFVNLKDTTNTEGIKQLQAEIKAVPLTNTSTFISYLQLVLEAFLVFEKEQSFIRAKEIVAPIWEQLQRQENWYYKDILIMANIYYLFDEKAVDTIISTMLIQVEKYKNYKASVNLDTVILLNYCFYLTERGRVLESEPYLDKALANARKNKHSDYLLQAKMRKVVLLIAQDKAQEATRLTNEIMVTLDCLERPHLKKDFQETWLEITKKKRV
ncbi:hypothetical protein HCI99_04815 [Listeria booriae]|uniref:HTH-type transcriptional regulator Rgg C-terminal domain-containing protein n=1 Tax=Listeria booriae TaxID=1552123 RepID=A0A7X0XB38_9LIST|nr:hypothetical protein [Listeria booriae]MBC1490945.1 hypothetical protein [Listeria booriae]MBC1491140.1 hypothetical protein [Listeria booriae]